MKRLVDVFWIVVLIVSAGAVVGGFIGGRSIGNAAVARRGPAARMPVPDPIEIHHFERVLSGAHSLDVTDQTDTSTLADVENVVATRPSGWAPRFAPHVHAPSKIALVLVDCGRDPAFERPFIDAPFPLTVACDAASSESPELVARARANGKLVLVQFSERDASDHDARVLLEERYKAWRARGLIGAVAADDGAGARDLAQFLAGHGGLALDTLETPEASFYAAARARRISALTRDVIADGRDDRAYTAFMLTTAVGISRRTGVAVVVLHAKPRTYADVRKFVGSVAKNDIKLVTIDDLGTRPP